ncbi:MAG: hypothetical protein P8141_03155, partial [Gammaproteobacteria bacterium]
ARDVAEPYPCVVVSDRLGGEKHLLGYGHAQHIQDMQNAGGIINSTLTTAPFTAVKREHIASR